MRRQHWSKRTPLDRFTSGYRQRDMSRRAVRSWVTAKMRSGSRAGISRWIAARERETDLAVAALLIVTPTASTERALANASNYKRWLSLIRTQLRRQVGTASSGQSNRHQRTRVGLLAREVAVYRASSLCTGVKPSDDS